MKQLRSSFWMKVVAVLLIAASSFGMFYFGCLAVLELACFGVGDWNGVVAHYYASSDYNERALNRYLMSLGSDNLTYLGEQAYDALEEELAPDKTNFRYRVLDTEGRVLYTNAAGDWDAEVDESCVQRLVYTVQNIYGMEAVQAYLSSDTEYYESAVLDGGINFLGDSSDYQAVYTTMVNTLSDILRLVYDTSDEEERIAYGMAFFYELWEGSERSGEPGYLWRLLYLLSTEYGGIRYELTADGKMQAVFVGPSFSGGSISVSDSGDGTGESETEQIALRRGQMLYCLLQLAQDADMVDSELDSMWQRLGFEEDTDSEWAAAFALLRERTKSALSAFRSSGCCILEWSVASELPVQDGLKIASVRYANWKKSFKSDCACIVLIGLVGLLALIWLLYSCGHVEGVEGLHLSTLDRCPQDLLFVVTAAAVGGIALLIVPQLDNLTLYQLFGQSVAERYLMCGVIGLVGTVIVLLMLPLLVGSAVQLKDHSFCRRTVLAALFRLIGRGLRLLLRGVVELVRGLSLSWRAGLLYTGFWLVIAVILVMFYDRWQWSVLGWLAVLLLWLTGLTVVVRWTSSWKKVQQAGCALAEGDLSYQTDTSRFPRDLKQHAERLNAASHIVEDAVQEQMRSDRFRTELITNVSHDLKTPLTSIINYVDLLKKLDLQDEKARGYLEVLDRKSQRLKTLTEDLVEASKASAGVLPVNMERLEAGELLRQAAGEYEDKFRAARLEIKLNTPEHPVWIMADGRHTWRILDNFFSNCTKYAMPGTRVYVDAVEQGDQVLILVKNISADPLNMPADELMERFVRGDSSRTTEGSGLGLSIAQSLARIQGAEVTLQVDGDLFKAILSFPAAPAPGENGTEAAGQPR